jgi:glyoxylase-like metal-dependent hydrolase (beta-lactamase superfamily II)
MNPSDRRTFVRTLLGGAAGVTLAWPARAQQAPAPLTATKLTDRLAVVGGAGGNIGLIIGNDGLMMIDGGTANRAADVARTIADVSPRMVQVLFNTHYHFDHVGSNELLGAKGAKIIAHENVKKRLATTFDNPAMGRKMEALAPAGQPMDTFTAGGKLTFGMESLEYTHTPLAHTDGDAFLVLRTSNVLHTGDLLWIGRYPVVDYTVGGSLASMAGTLGQMDRLVDNNTRIIPGHGPASVTREQMRQTREVWLAINQRLEDHAKAGRSVEAVIAAGPTRDFDMRIGTQNSEGFLRQAYGGVLATR